MCTGWCPLAADWGNVAEIVGALATIAVGVAAFFISHAANKTAQKLAKLEIDREDEAKLLRKHEQTLILVGMAGALGDAFAALNACNMHIQREGEAERMLHNDDSRRACLNILSYGKFEIPESTRSRMHFLEPVLAAQVLRTHHMIDRLILSINGLGMVSPDVARYGMETMLMAVPQVLSESKLVFDACQAAQRDLGLSAADLDLATAGRLPTKE
jgi:hypothetical protein